MEELSEAKRGGVSPPELKVHVLEQEQDAGWSCENGCRVNYKVVRCGTQLCD